MRVGVRMVRTETGRAATRVPALVRIARTVMNFILGVVMVG